MLRVDFDAIKQARWGDLSGLSLAGLVRLSFELAEDVASEPSAYLTGRDIRGRDEQELDCRSYVTSRNGHYVHTYEEPDTSAYKRRRMKLPDGTVRWHVIRPIFEGALNDLRRGVAPGGTRLDGLIVYDLDRLTRDNRHLEDCIDIVAHVGRPVIDVSGTLDLLTDNGRAMARVLVAMANKQSADSSRRVRRKHLALAREGIPVGGTRPFGWKADKRTLAPAEAEEIRSAVRRIRAGVPPGQVRRDWYERGVKTPRGNTWKWAPFIEMLRNPRLCGYRSTKTSIEVNGSVTYRWEIVRGPDGQDVRGQWEPIIDREEWEAMVDRIGRQPAAGNGAGHTHGNPKYLLTGIILCGRCQHHPPLWGNASQYAGTGNFYYQCGSKTQGGCGGNSRSGPKVDDLIRDLVFKVHDERGFAGQHEPDEDGPEDTRLAEIEELLAEAYGAWKARRLDGSEYFMIRADLTAERDQLVSARTAERAVPPADAGFMDQVRIQWAAAPMGDRRAFIRQYLSAVILHPIELLWDERKGRMIRPTRFNPALIEPVWRH